MEATTAAARNQRMEFLVVPICDLSGSSDGRSNEGARMLASLLVALLIEGESGRSLSYVDDCPAGLFGGCWRPSYCIDA